MGVNLSLYVADESIDRPFITGSFYEEVIQDTGFSYVPFSEFLSEEEINILTPNPYGEIILGHKDESGLWEKDKSKILKVLAEIVQGIDNVSTIDSILDRHVIKSEKPEDRERNPQRLMDALKKVEQYLIQNAAKLPLVHKLYASQVFEEDNSVSSTMVKDVKAFFEGDLFHYDSYADIRNKIHIRSYWEDTGKIDFYVDVKDTVTINNQTFYTKSITKAEQFKDVFSRIYAFLEEAIKQNKKVLWEHS